MEFDLMQLITNGLFPIGMCLLMWARMDKQEERHQAEMDKLSEAVNNNTIAVVKLTEKLGGVGDE